MSRVSCLNSFLDTSLLSARRCSPSLSCHSLPTHTHTHICLSHLMQGPPKCHEQGIHYLNFPLCLTYPSCQEATSCLPSLSPPCPSSVITPQCLCQATIYTVLNISFRTRHGPAETLWEWFQKDSPLMKNRFGWYNSTGIQNMRERSKKRNGSKTIHNRNAGMDNVTVEQDKLAR